MDNVPKSLMIYDKYGNVEHHIKLNPKKHLNDARVISFTYSHKEKRIGATNNDYSISFWDFSDKFKYEKSFHYNSEDLRDQIYYIEFCSKWLTVDQTHRIHMFAVENPTE